MSQQKIVDDLDFLQGLIDTPDPPKGVRGPRKQKDTRDMDHWFKLEHIVMGTCSQGDECLGIVSDNGKGPGRVTSIVNSVEMCRFDFLDELAYVNE